ncbi:alpha-mannosidase 2 [Ischnura elegans]|uniref:alpha-mannosidase 2 n=1 Tax=Ischnura elegans TaxID=197161 RepID=UPI001ED885C7|nr:alpha-mannosidase 2 [Ischnura elegans]
MKSKEYWDTSFEERYKQSKPKWPLKVIVVPHSHNDPGWLRTFDSYFHYQTRQILDNMVDKMVQYPNMTFIWTEISFLSEWWESAHPSKRRIVKRLVEDGRLEIATGGWVMTDEATSHLYAMLDQLIEGHQWMRSQLGVSPQTGWAVDPFGHGSTMPYLLKASGVSRGAVIQRIHYAWKQWLAEQQMMDFIWKQGWESTQMPRVGLAGIGDSPETSLLIHNQPFDIYSIKHSCGPHPQVCLAFDFRRVAGEYTEATARAVPVDARNVAERSRLLLEQYARAASLSPFNVALIPLGDDFRYDHAQEWDQQYESYSRIIEHIRTHPADYSSASVSFGTPADYFRVVRERATQAGPHSIRTLKGDFFVYSDIFSEGRPAYWSGYFTTRPYWKALDREVEAALRSAEIMYTAALSRVRGSPSSSGGAKIKALLERDYERLVRARRALALFQHHDAITGTSKAFVMHDYALKLFAGLRDSVRVQARCAQVLLDGGSGGSGNDEVAEAGGIAVDEAGGGRVVVSAAEVVGAKPQNEGGFSLVPDTERESYERLPRRLPVTLSPTEPLRKIVLFNPLAQHRQDLVRLHVAVKNPALLRVLDPEGSSVTFQINPVWNDSTVEGSEWRSSGMGSGSGGGWNPRREMSSEVVEVIFIAELPPLALAVYSLQLGEKSDGVVASKATIFCGGWCPRALISRGKERSWFGVSKMEVGGDVQLENAALRLLVDGRTGLLRSITRKAAGINARVALSFAAYPSAQFHSGAYLFMPDPNARDPERQVLDEEEEGAEEDDGGPDNAGDDNDDVHVGGGNGADEEPGHRQRRHRRQIIITSGPVASELSVRYGRLLLHTVRIYHTPGPMGDGVYVENEIDFGMPPRYRETELFMRLSTDLGNCKETPNNAGGNQNTEDGQQKSQPRFYTDKNGFGTQRRETVPRVGIEGNYFPATTMAYIEDDPSTPVGEGQRRHRRRITLLVSHASGVAGWRPGWLEVMLDRRTLYDDSRGMGEGVVDNKRTLSKHWILLEDVGDVDSNEYSRPSILVNHISNGLLYPTSVFVAEEEAGNRPAVFHHRARLLSRPFPCDEHLVTLRTLPESAFPQFPSASALLVVHRQAFDCSASKGVVIPRCALAGGSEGQAAFHAGTRLLGAPIASISRVSLTGLHRHGPLRSLDAARVQPMHMMALNITFAMP